MGKATTFATLLSLVLAGWPGAAGATSAAPSRAAGAAQAPATPSATSPQGGTGEAAPVAVRNASPPAAGREKRRRPSYASCNRESHKRALRGGARRRFLIRCRLGYERRPPAGQNGTQGPGQGHGPPPARRP